jgi:hypothetical protein
MSYRSIISLMPKTSVDADAQAFLTAAAITDPTISSSINKLVIDLKSAGVWTKMKAIYPMVGGTASTHKFNLKDPRDLNAAFRLQFFGGWTHSANGAKPNGTNANANTFLNCRSVLDRISNHLSFYSRDLDTGGAQIDICAFDYITNYMLCCDYNNSGGGATVRCYTAGTQLVVSKALTVNTKAFFIASRTSSTMLKAYRNGSQIGIQTANETALAPNSNFTFSQHGNLAIQYSNKQCAFSSIGDGLTDTEAANLYTAVQNFQTTLNRQV